MLNLPVIMCLLLSLLRFGETAKPVDNVHAPDFSNNRCASFLHPFMEYHSHGEYVDQMELQESFIVRFDSWPCSNLPQWQLNTNENYIKYFVNDKVRSSCISSDIAACKCDYVT